MSSRGNYILQDCSLFQGLKNKIGLILIKWLLYGCKASSFYLFWCVFSFFFLYCTELFYFRGCVVTCTRCKEMLWYNWKQRVPNVFLDLYSFFEKYSSLYAFSDINVIKLKQLGPDLEIWKLSDVLPMISTESQLLNEIFRLTLKIFLFLGHLRLAFSCKPFTYSRDHLLWSNKRVHILLNSKKCTYLKV